MYILWWIIVGLIAGWITGKLMKGSGYGALMDIVVGIIGAVIGGFIMEQARHGRARWDDLHDRRCRHRRRDFDVDRQAGHRAKVISRT